MLIAHASCGTAWWVLPTLRRPPDCSPTLLPPAHPLCPPTSQAGIEKCTELRVLYASNNRIKDWAEVERLAALPLLEDLLLIGNPLYCEWRDNNALPQYRVEVGAGGPSASWGSGVRPQGDWW